jgi:hypothetical protein
LNIRQFRFQRWQANLRVLGVDEIKTIPRVPHSHAFVERLIGTIRREHLDRIWFWNQHDLERKLEEYKEFTTNLDVTLDWPESPQRNEVVLLRLHLCALIHIAGNSTAVACFRPRSLHSWNSPHTG